MQKFCQNCGTELKEGADICLNCGRAVPKTTTTATANKGKSKIAAGLLAIFLGTLGIHNFYLGYKGKAIGQLLISLLTCGIGAPIVGVWALIEAIMIFTGSINTDADGNPLAD